MTETRLRSCGGNTRLILGQKVKCMAVMFRDKGGLELKWRRQERPAFPGIVCGKRNVAEGSTR